VCPFTTTFLDGNSGNHVQFGDTASIQLNGPKSLFPTPEFAAETIRPGGDVAIIGLFRSHYGANRNIPIMRVGNIAAVLGEPVKTYAGYMEAYLIEARSIAGLSGSPVFAVRAPELTVIEGMARAQGKSFSDSPYGFALLGLMHGHFDVPNLNEDVVTDESQPERSVHTAIGVVIPVQKIMETIQHPDLTDMRKKAAEKLRKEGATPDLASDDVEASSPANAVNPNHREDFNSLLDAAVRKREPKD
jgi:hypothetical protein